MKRVKFISETAPFSGMTVGKCYDVLREEPKMYHVTNDAGEHKQLFRWRFEVVPDEDPHTEALLQAFGGAPC